MNIAVKRLRSDATLPTRGSEHAAGLDLYAAHEAVIHPLDRDVVGTGIAIAIPEGYVGLIWPRSGLADRQGIGILAGVIDSDYRGGIGVLLQNHGDDTLLVTAGDRIAQLIIQPIAMLDPVWAEELPDTVRGEAGFGSSGK